MGSARKSILVADASKYERTAPVKIGHISDLDYFVTDEQPPQRIRQICQDHDVRIILAGAA